MIQEAGRRKRFFTLPHTTLSIFPALPQCQATVISNICVQIQKMSSYLHTAQGPPHFLSPNLTHAPQGPESMSLPNKAQLAENTESSHAVLEALSLGSSSQPTGAMSESPEETASLFFSASDGCQLSLGISELRSRIAPICFYLTLFSLLSGL